MFEEEFKKLTPYDKYIIFIQDLKDQFLFATGAYERGYMEVEFKNTKNTQYYLDNIISYKQRLDITLSIVKMAKDDIDINSLSESERKLLNSDEDLLNKAEKLIEKMDNFLSQYNINCNI